MRKDDLVAIRTIGAEGWDSLLVRNSWTSLLVRNSWTPTRVTNCWLIRDHSGLTAVPKITIGYRSQRQIHLRDTVPVLDRVRGVSGSVIASPTVSHPDVIVSDDVDSPQTGERQCGGLGKWLGKKICCAHL